jgi:hypothetical protein
MEVYVREHETCFGRNNGSVETAEVYINQDKQLAHLLASCNINLIIQYIYIYIYIYIDRERERERESVLLQLYTEVWAWTNLHQSSSLKLEHCV